ncbi:hypothetical protein X748_01330 [Mesorhizobium sp. LNJC386A00]|nr:hypothetical protein X748_01330 [Mesorhizobium sp. LNJC386A00]
MPCANASAGKFINRLPAAAVRAKVNLYDGRVYGPGGEGFIRLNVGCPRPLLRQGLERMSSALASL